MAIKHLREQPLIVVEGYMDVITLHLHGFTGAVAGLGTAIGINHLNLINQYTQSPIFCLDGDQAGQSATLKLVELYLPNLKSGMLPKFIILNEKDPDSFFTKYTSEEFDIQIQNAYSLSELLWLSYSNGFNMVVPEDAATVLKNLQNVVNSIPDIQLKSQFLSFIRNKIFESKRFKNTNNHNKSTLKKSYSMLSSNVLRCVVLLACIFKYPSVLVDIEEQLNTVTFEDQILNDLKDFVLDQFNYGTLDIVASMKNDSKIYGYYNELCVLPIYENTYNKISNEVEALNVCYDTLNLMNKKDITLQIADIDRQLKELNTRLIKVDSETEVYNEIYKKIKQLIATKMALKNKN